jgi:energy-coupling factor transporter transmembrane protein EcfT
MLVVRRLRAQNHARTPLPSRFGTNLRTIIDLLTAALVTTLRRARDMSDAIEARGGFGAFADSNHSPTTIDWTAILVVAALTSVAFAIG